MQSNSTLNKAIRRIIRDCNDEQLLKDENYAFYVLIGDEYLEKVSFAWYDNETVGDGIYDEGDDYEIDGEDVTKEEWMETLE